MKKTMAWLFSLLLLLALSSCSGTSGSRSGSEASDREGNTGATDQSTELSGDESPAQKDNSVGGNSLVIYFSCTGNTEAVAKEIAAQTGATLFEIVPQQPYTDEDLNYSDDHCRANQEMNDESARPAISGAIENLSEYDTLYIGYPIWWGTMPRILNTFFDAYDLSGKTILPFCTSGSSGISESISAIREAEPESVVKDGLRIAGSSADNCTSEVAAWLEKNEL